jgi:cell division protein ZapA
MARADISVNGRAYAIQCDDGQESHVTRLAKYLDQKVAGLVASVGQAGDSMLLVMAALVIADEYAELLSQQGKSGVEVASLPDRGQAETIVRSINALAERVETIAARLEAD